jgi:hypothetical protein
MQLDPRELSGVLDAVLAGLPEEHRVGNRPY